MTTRERILTVLLGIFGVVAAGAISLAANSISGTRSGSAEPVSLASSQAPTKPAPAARAAARASESGDDHGPGDDLIAGDDDGSSGPVPRAPAVTIRAPLLRPGGGGGGDDPTGDRSGPSGSSGSGSSGSDSSGPGPGTTSVDDDPPATDNRSGPGG